MKAEYTRLFEIYGYNLKQIRESKKITLKELSIKTKIKEHYLKKIEKGEAYGITISKIFKIANVLQTPTHLFIEGI